MHMDKPKNHWKKGIFAAATQRPTVSREFDTHAQAKAATKIQEQAPQEPTSKKVDVEAIPSQEYVVIQTRWKKYV